MASLPPAPIPTTAILSCDAVLKVANQDALRVYRDLSHYQISLILEDDGWHVDYDLVKPLVAGGGPHYVIDATTGAILHKRYEQ